MIMLDTTISNYTCMYKDYWCYVFHNNITGKFILQFRTHKNIDKLR